MDVKICAPADRVFLQWAASRVSTEASIDFVLDQFRSLEVTLPFRDTDTITKLETLLPSDTFELQSYRHSDFDTSARVVERLSNSLGIVIQWCINNVNVTIPAHASIEEIRNRYIRSLSLKHTINGVEFFSAGGEAVCECCNALCIAQILDTDVWAKLRPFRDTDTEAVFLARSTDSLQEFIYRINLAAISNGQPSYAYSLIHRGSQGEDLVFGASQQPDRHVFIRRVGALQRALRPLGSDFVVDYSFGYGAPFRITSATTIDSLTEQYDKQFPQDLLHALLPHSDDFVGTFEAVIQQSRRLNRPLRISFLKYPYQIVHPNSSAQELLRSFLNSMNIRDMKADDSSDLGDVVVGMAYGNPRSLVYVVTGVARVLNRSVATNCKLREADPPIRLFAAPHENADDVYARYIQEVKRRGYASL